MVLFMARWTFDKSTNQVSRARAPFWKSFSSATPEVICTTDELNRTAKDAVAGSTVSMAVLKNISGCVCGGRGENICTYVHIHIDPAVRLFGCLFVCLFVCFLVCLSVHVRSIGTYTY